MSLSVCNVWILVIRQLLAHPVCVSHLDVVPIPSHLCEIFTHLTLCEGDHKWGKSSNGMAFICEGAREKTTATRKTR